MGLGLRSGAVRGPADSSHGVKRPWEPLDILIEIVSGRIFFDVRLKDDHGFKLVAGGWPRESCSRLSLGVESDGGPEHAAGYTNGREWLCTKCYEKFSKPLDKVSE